MCSYDIWKSKSIRPIFTRSRIRNSELALYPIEFSYGPNWLLACTVLRRSVVGLLRLHFKLKSRFGEGRCNIEFTSCSLCSACYYSPPAGCLAKQSRELLQASLRTAATRLYRVPR